MQAILKKFSPSDELNCLYPAVNRFMDGNLERDDIQPQNYIVMQLKLPPDAKVIAT